MEAIQWKPDVLNDPGKSKLVAIIRRFKKLDVKLQCLTSEGKKELEF